MLALRRAALICRKGGGFVFANVEAAAFIARTHPAAPDAVRAAYDGLVSDLKRGPLNSSDLWTGTDFLHVATPAGAPLPMMNLFADSLGPTATGGVIGHPLYGATANGYDGVLTVPTSPAALTHYAQNDASLFVVTRNPDRQSGTNPQFGVGGSGAATSAWLCTRNGSGNAVFRINDTTSTAVSGVTDGSGTWMAVRDGATKRLFRNGVQVGADASVTSTGRSASPIQFGAAFSTFAQDQALLFGMGRKRSAAEAVDFHLAVSRFKAAIGWQPLFAIPTGAAAIAAAATPLPPPVLTVAMPDNPGGLFAADNLAPPGKGFTPTGAARDPSDGSFWVAAFGRNVQSDTSRTHRPAIVHLAPDCTTVLGVIDLVALGAPAAGIQGVAIDGSDGTLWVAVARDSGSGANLLHLARSTAAPQLLAAVSISPALTPNAISFDPMRDALCIAGSSAFALYDRTGARLPASAAFSVAGPYIDQAVYCADLDAWLVTGGENGASNNGYVQRVGRGDQGYGYPRVSAIYRSAESSAIEGITRDAATGIATLFNDRWYHGSGSGASSNAALRVQLPF